MDDRINEYFRIRTYTQLVFRVDKMSVEVYSEGRIQFIPADDRNPDHTYSNRCLIELRQHDIGNYALRAIDLRNKKFVRKKTGSDCSFFC